MGSNPTASVMSKTIAIYAGSFDPITNGHVWMIEEAAKLFDTLIVAIGVNPVKQPTFSLKQRLDAIYASVSHLKTKGGEAIVVDSYLNRFLVDYAQAMNATHIVRGIRSSADFEYERGMRQINADLKPSIHSVFLIPPRELSEVSSSFVKSLVGPQGWQDLVKKYVPQCVCEIMVGVQHV